MRVLLSKYKLQPKDKLKAQIFRRLLANWGGENPKRPGTHQNPKGTENHNPKQTEPQKKETRNWAT